MKLKYIIGVLALLLLMVGTASASTTFEITKSNIYSGDIPEGASIKVEVTYDEVHNTITFVDKSIGLTDPRLTWVAYNLDVDMQQILGYTRSSIVNDEEWLEVPDEVDTEWKEKNNFGALGEFGNFARVYAIKNPTEDNQFYKVVVKLPEFSGSIPGNEIFNNQVGVHFVCNEFSGFVAGQTPEEPDVPIPEFPTIALPVAAILGLMFILGRRKE